MSGDLEGAHATLQRAVQIGERFGDVNLQACARCFQVRVLLRLGQLVEGLARIDETMLAAARGELSPVVTGVVYCNAIANCQRMYALDRAREWTAALGAWCDAQPQLVHFTGACLVHRAEILQLGGAWPEAVEQARLASKQGEADPGIGAGALYQQAEVARLRGELSAAEDLYKSSSQFGREPQPGLALLRLAQGKSEAAATAIQRVVAESSDALDRAKFLPAAVEILLAIGKLDEARAASNDLRSIAARFGTEVLDAMAAHAEGSVLLGAGEAQAALSPLRRALSVWQRIGAPYIAARIRVELARACLALGDEDTAQMERDAAQAAFAKLGAASASSSSQAEKRHGLTAREIEVLRLVAAGKTNKTIAKELCLSEKTIDRHLSNIFTKVNVGSRAAATAYAYENGLV
jgi:DNA-binding NarL/FixJ family response regulator